MPCRAHEGRWGAAMRHRAVREIMSCGEICRATPATTVRDACCLMARQQCGSVLVVDGERLVGIVTHGDLVERVLAAGLDPKRIPLGEIMTRYPTRSRPMRRSTKRSA